MKNNSNKAAIVTGASQGIGRALAGYLVGKGYEVLLVSRNQEKLKKVSDELVKLNPSMPKPSIAALDVSDYESVELVNCRKTNF
jgi:short-subunit dehydrogenase